MSLASFRDLRPFDKTRIERVEPTASMPTAVHRPPARRRPWWLRAHVIALTWLACSLAGVGIGVLAGGPPPTGGATGSGGEHRRPNTVAPAGTEVDLPDEVDAAGLSPGPLTTNTTTTAVAQGTTTASTPRNPTRGGRDSGAGHTPGTSAGPATSAEARRPAGDPAPTTTPTTTTTGGDHTATTLPMGEG